MGILDKWQRNIYTNKIAKQMNGDARFDKVFFKISEDSSLIFIGGIDLENNELLAYIRDLDDRVQKGIAIKADEENDKFTYTLNLKKQNGLEGYLNITPHYLGTCLALGVYKPISQKPSWRKRNSFMPSQKEIGVFVEELLIPEIQAIHEIDVNLGDSETPSEYFRHVTIKGNPNVDMSDGLGEDEKPFRYTVIKSGKEEK